MVGVAGLVEAKLLLIPGRGVIQKRKTIMLRIVLSFIRPYKNKFLTAV